MKLSALRYASNTIFDGEISTAQMRRRCNDLASWLFRELRFPAGAFLITGTGIVPPNDFTLAVGDNVRITIEGVGTLENPVAEAVPLDSGKGFMDFWRTGWQKRDTYKRGEH